MTVLVGQPIDARELEQAISQWSPDKFASMCNDLVWAISGRRWPGMPSFTERVNAADGGIDAEWEVEVSDGDSVVPTPIIGPGWNVFQYKKRDLIAQDRKRIISNVKSDLKGAVTNLTRARQRLPSRYVLFLNVDLKHDQTVALKSAILEGYDRALGVHVEVIGAAEIATFLNDQPHLRAAYFSPLAFKTWEEANRSHRNQKLFGFDVALVGREGLLTRLRDLVDAPHIAVIVVSGPHDIGKSRLVLEATHHRPQDIVFAVDPRSMKIDDYRNLVAERRNVVCVVEDPDPERVERLINEILGIERLKIIITVPNSEQMPPISYGLDNRVESLFVEGLSDENARKLLLSTQKHLDFGVESWILDRAGGNPGILLAAATVAETLRTESGNFETGVGQEFARRIELELSGNSLKCAELLSPLTHVGISGRFEKEIRAICDIFGDGHWNLTEVFSELESLEKTGLAKRGGSFAEISIPFLANHLVSALLRGRKDELFALFARLEQAGRVRLIRRLSQVTSPEVNHFWDALFDPNDSQAPFGTLSSALNQSQMLRFIAGAAPEKTIVLLEKSLLGTSHEDRLAITGDARREIMWALEQLLFRAKTSRRALTLVWLLAEAETETWGNNATGVLLECFHPLHSQMPLPLDERLAALREFTSASGSRDGALVAIRAAGKALSQRAVGLRHSMGTAPLDKRPVFTYGDLYDYARDVIDHLFSIAESAENEIAHAAVEQLPTLVSELATQGRPKEALERLNKLVAWAVSEKPGVSIASLYRVLHFVRRVFLERAQKKDTDANGREEFQQHVKDLERLVYSLESGGFSVRLKRWASGWHSKDHEELLINGQKVYRSEYELENLAKELLSNSALLTPQILSWLVSGEANQSHQFFYHLGRLDVEGCFRSKMVKIGTDSRGSIAFASYWGGQAEIDRRKAEARLEELASLGAIAGKASIATAARLGPSKLSLQIVRHEISVGRVSSNDVSEILYGDWIEKLSPDDLLSLLEIIAGKQFENAKVITNVLTRWIHHDKSLEGPLGEFAWKCLEVMPPVLGNEAYDCDQVASKLAQIDPERGFKLLESLLMQPEDRRSWCPIDRYVGGNDFWSVLHKSDPRKALRTVFYVALQDPLYGFRVTWNLEELLNQAADADMLLEFALEAENHAILVAESITSAKDGFWPIAFGIVQKFPTSEKVRNALTQGVEQMGRIIEGPYSQHTEACRREVEKRLRDPGTPAAARPWLQDILGRLEEEIAQHTIWEYDEDANDLRRYIEIEDKTSPERIWAISRVLKYADWKDVRRMLTVEDIEDVLPQVDLPERKRKALEKALEVWRSGV